MYVCVRACVRVCVCVCVCVCVLKVIVMSDTAFLRNHLVKHVSEIPCMMNH